ncbi:MAG: type I restriction enzyme HsdR N-terminal domain-containing protein [Candidatus Poribacteria bacterium]|nr:type I restriction enzyme HsdR N-terminal domain-containing protein [Candidatus Poribacteria bacterium]
MDKTFKSKVECTSEIKRLRLLLQRLILRPEVIPPKLAKSYQWVVWAYEVSEQEDGMFRVDKKPYQPQNPKYEVSRTYPSGWSDLSDLETALRCMKENPHIDGIGYIFAEGDGLIGIDFDNCRDPITDAIRPEYQFWIEKLGSYAEVSPSGTGVKVWIEGTVADRYFKSMVSTGFRILNFAGGEIEIYRRGQYFTVTTQMINGYDSIRGAQAELDVICEFSVSTTDWNFRYFPYPDDQLVEDENKELSLLQDSSDEMIGYIDEPDRVSNMVKEPLKESPSPDSQPQSIAKSYYSVSIPPRCTQCGKKCDLGHELCHSCYRSGTPEEKVEDAVYDYFSKFQGFTAVRQYEINIGTYTPRPDVVLLDATGNLFAIAECKREGIIYDGIKQLKSYLSASDTQFGVFANSIDPDDWIFYENLRRHRFEENIPRCSRFETEIKAQRPIESIREEKSRLSKEIIEERKKQKQIRSEIEYLNQKLAELNGNIVQKKQNLRRIEVEINSLWKKSSDLKEEININSEKKEVLEFNQLKSTRDTLISEINTKTDEINTKTDEIKSLDELKERLHKEIGIMNHEINNLTEKYNITLKIKSLDELKERLHKEILEKQRESERLMESIYGEFEKEFERLQEIESYIARKQQLARNIQEQYADYEINRVEIGKKIQRRISVSQERETVLKQLRDVVNRLKTAEAEQKPGIERHREQLVQDLRNQKNKYELLTTEIRQLQKAQSTLKLRINPKEHQSQYTVIDILPTYLQIEEEIDMLKTEKFELEAEIGHKIFELIPKKIEISTLKGKEN